MSLFFPGVPVLIRGGGDLGSGVAYRLRVAGFPVSITELPAPSLIRRKVAYGAAVFEGSLTVGGLTARLVDGPAQAQAVIEECGIPVLVDPEGCALAALEPVILVDARMAKANAEPRTTRYDAPLVIALGPGFTAPFDCHAIVETNRGHDLGRVIWDGQAQPDTKTPGLVGSQRARRVLRAPADGRVVPAAEIGAILDQGDLVARVGQAEVRAPFRGALRGLIHHSVPVTAGLKIGDLDPRANPDYCFTISDKSLAVGGGVLEAVLAFPAIRERLMT